MQGAVVRLDLQQPTYIFTAFTWLELLWEPCMEAAQDQGQENHYTFQKRQLDGRRQLPHSAEVPARWIEDHFCSLQKWQDTVPRPAV